jgi:protein-S-isoprenylcysteine O-methyltransferase Ste14
MQNQNRKISVRMIIQVLLYLFFFPMLPLLLSGRWGWWEAWFYALSCFLSLVVSRVLVARKFPDLMAERSKFLEHKDAQSWDKLLAPLVGLGGNLVPLVVGLEAHYGQVHIFSLPVKLAAMLVYLGGFTWGSYALLENRFFSGMVRLQTDRGHQLVRSGPYRIMRHPGYAGALLTYFATPFFLDSVWAFLPAVLMLVALVIRTRLEDDFLQAELPGYKEYAREVRYRLIPGIW